MNDLLQSLSAHRLGIYCGAFVIIFCLELYFAPPKTVLAQRERWLFNGVFTLINLCEPLIRILFVLTLSPKWSRMSFLESLPLPLEIFGSLIVVSGLAWLVHFSMHKIPFLWRLHRIHHSDIHIDSTTTARFHPLESFLHFFLIFYPAVYIFGVRGEIFIACVLLDSLSNLFIHSNLPLGPKTNRILGFIWITPDQHRLHHSADPRHFDSNFGTNLCIWDRLFRTRNLATEKFSYGSKDVPESRLRNLPRIFFLQ